MTPGQLNVLARVDARMMGGTKKADSTSSTFDRLARAEMARRRG